MNPTIKKALLSYVPALKDYLRGRMERKIEESKTQTPAAEQQEPPHPAERDAQARREYADRKATYYSDMRRDNPRDSKFYTYIERKERQMMQFSISPNGYNFMSLRLLYQIKMEAQAIRQYLEESTPILAPTRDAVRMDSGRVTNADREAIENMQTMARMHRSLDRSLDSTFPATPEPDYHEDRVRQEINELHNKDSQQ